MLRRVSSLAAGRRSKWVVIAFWVVLGFALFGFQPKLQDATVNENEAFLPASSESTELNDLIEERFADGRAVDLLVVYNRDGGLDPEDRRRIMADAEAVCEPGEIIDLQGVIAPYGPVCGPQGGPPVASGDEEGAPPLISADGDTAMLVIRTTSDDSELIQDNVDAAREITPGPDAAEGELRSYVSGVGGIVSDSIEVFESIDVQLLIVTVTLVLVLLLAIYRSPVIALVPLFVVAIAYGIAAALVYGLVEGGVVEVNGQTTSLLIVLMFGAGTDYCLLIVARYREELRRSADKHEAMAHATERTAPAILSAGGTVFAAMLVLTLADLKSTQTMGPVLALGVAVMLLAGLTFLPALLAALGRNAFWPAIPRQGTEQRAPVGVWRRIGHFVHDNPALALGVTVAVLVAGSLGSLADQGTIDFGEGFRDEPESVEGQHLIERDLSGGQTAPTTVVVSADAATATIEALRASEGVDGASQVAASDDGRLARIDATLAFDPFSDRANDLVPELRETVRDAAPGATALVGGTTAENFDTSETLDDDAKVIVPLILIVIFLILCLLLRAVVAPLYLVATVVLSYAFTIGATTLLLTEVFNQPDTDPGLPTFAFIFLVALGVDYNIFLISRIREEAASQETKEAVISGLERTGGVITSAGLILAGTFTALMSLPLESLFQIGFTIAFGLLVDTFIVRTVLVPAIAFELGERNWWPSKVTHDRAH